MTETWFIWGSLFRLPQLPFCASAFSLQPKSSLTSWKFLSILFPLISPLLPPLDISVRQPTVWVCLGLRVLPGHRAILFKTRKLPGKPGWVSYPKSSPFFPHHPLCNTHKRGLQIITLHSVVFLLCWAMARMCLFCVYATPASVSGMWQMIHKWMDISGVYDAALQQQAI